MIPTEIYKLKKILDSFLGPSKRELDDTYQLQYGCIKCIEDKGEKERNKFNLEVNLRLGVYHCWSCFDNMQGSILKLIKLYGNDELLKDYKETIKSLKESKLYNLHFNDNDFNINFNTENNNKELELPTNFKQLTSENQYNKGALEYLFKRGIDWDIIKKHSIGFTDYDKNNIQVSSRIIIPSFNEFGELNYWTGRDFTKLSHRQKYFNPVVERKGIIFNEDKIQWDADITLVEGPFDHIIVPNSIPLLGKSLKEDYLLYQKLNEKANSNINIFLDADAEESAVLLYKLLNHGRLYNKIRVIPIEKDKDPSLIFQESGRKGICECLSNSKQISEVFLY